MSISAVSPVDLTSLTTQNSWQNLQQAFQQVGTDLQSGNLSAAEADFVTLSKDLPASAGSSTSAVGKAYQQLAGDLQSGNLSAAQTDYATLKQDIQTQSSTSQTGGHHHHHHGGGGGSSAVSQLLDSTDSSTSSSSSASSSSLFGASSIAQLYALSQGTSSGADSSLSVTA